MAFLWVEGLRLRESLLMRGKDRVVECGVAFAVLVERPDIFPGYTVSVNTLGRVRSVVADINAQDTSSERCRADSSRTSCSTSRITTPRPSVCDPLSRLDISLDADRALSVPIRLAWFWISNYLSHSIGSLICVAVLQLSGVGGRAGWRYLYLIEVRTYIGARMPA